MADDRLDEATVALARVTLAGRALAATLAELAVAVRDGTGAAAAALTVVADGRPREAVATDGWAGDLEQAQWQSGTGPALMALACGRVCRLPIGGLDAGGVQAAAAAAGVASVVSIPLPAPTGPLGVATLYGPSPGTGGLAHFGEVLAGAVTNALAYAEVCHERDNLRQALESRATIDYAVGILMSSGGRSPEQAFEMLVRASQRENRKLRDIATGIVERARARRPPAAPS